MPHARRATSDGSPPIAHLPSKYTGDMLLEHFAEYCERYIRIVDKQSRLVPLSLNTTQRVVVEEIRRLRQAGLPPRIICLKSRQVGISTLCEALMFYDAHANRNRQALVLAHKDKLSRALFAMARRMKDELPLDLQWKTKFDSAVQMHFAESDSSMKVEAVGETRGYTSPVVLLSEFAYFPGELDLVTLRAIMQTAPRETNTLVVIESTANGAGNVFHRLWVNAVAAKADPTLADWERGWTPIFVPWHKHDEYMMQPWFTPDQATVAERVLAKRFGLNMRQLAWRRWCIRTNCDDDLDAFNEAYPATWQDAFLLSGRPVFDRDAMRYYMTQIPPECRDPLPPQVEIDWQDKVKHVSILVPTERGRGRQYQPPAARHTYIVGVDPSEGDPKSDASPMAVLDQMTLSCVFTWHGRMPPDLLAEESMKLGWLYRWADMPAKIIFEANNHGIEFAKTLTRAEYPNIFYRTVSEESVAGEVTEKPGWFQTTRNKHAIINTFRKLVREKALEHIGDGTRIIRDPILVNEMSTLIYKDSVSGSVIEAQPGHAKDLVFAFAMALIAHRGDQEAPLEPLPEEEVISAALQVALMRERDPEGAERYALDIFGMTCDDLERVSEAKHLNQLRREALGTGLMR